MSLVLVDETTWKAIDDWLDKKFTIHGWVEGREAWFALPRIAMCAGGEALERGLMQYREWIERNMSAEHQAAMVAQILVKKWELPRAPLFRYCTHRLHDSSCPDRHKGVWEICGYENLDTPDEIYLLRRVVPVFAGGPTGGVIKVWRHDHECGHLRVWAANPEDAALCAN